MTDVERVELFEDRVAVTRVVPVPATPGRHTLQVGPLSALVSARNLGVIAGPGVTVEEVRVSRQQLSQDQADSALSAELRAALDALDASLRAAQAQQQRHDDSAQRAEQRVEAARSWTPRVLLEHDDLAAWVSALRQLEADALDTRLQAAAHRPTVAELQQERQQLQRRLHAARHAAQVWCSTVHLRVLVASESPSLRLRATLPCAVWRPVHRAHRSGASLRWEVGAMVWNATGEDWSAATLICSTARPGDHGDLPELEDDPLVVTRRAQVITVEARDVSVHHAREADADELPGVDDGGETRTYTAPGPVRIPSTGRPIHVPLASFEVPCSCRWRCHPELGPWVVEVSQQRNAGALPLLAGPVELLRDGSAVGRTEVGLVPAGEAFSLSWGSHDGVRVTRRVEQDDSQAMLSGRQTHLHKLALRVVHLGDEPVTVEVRERIPVSEVREVQVSQPVAQPALSAGPDADGFCSWLLELSPGDRKALLLDYQIEAPGRVALQ